jgi:hypothetical protein
LERLRYFIHQYNEDFDCFTPLGFLAFYSRIFYKCFTPLGFLAFYSRIFYKCFTPMGLIINRNNEALSTTLHNPVALASCMAPFRINP